MGQWKALCRLTTWTFVQKDNWTHILHLSHCAQFTILMSGCSLKFRGVILWQTQPGSVSSISSSVSTLLQSHCLRSGWWGHLCRAGDSCIVNIGRVFWVLFLLGFRFIVSFFAFHIQWPLLSSPRLLWPYLLIWLSTGCDWFLQTGAQVAGLNGWHQKLLYSVPTSFYRLNLFEWLVFPETFIWQQFIVRDSFSVKGKYYCFPESWLYVEWCHRFCCLG